MQSVLAAMLIVISVTACDDDEREAQPLDLLRFPTDMVLGGEESELLYVVGTNFDRRHAGGALQVIDLAALNERVDGATESALPLRIADVPVLGGVHIGSFGGQIARAVLDDGTERLFVPLRGEGGVTVVDMVGGGELRCHLDAGADCRRQMFDLLAPSGASIADPFAAAVVGEHVYVAALRTQATEEAGATSGAKAAYMARMSVEDPADQMVRSVGAMITRDLVAGPDNVHLFSIGALSPAVGGATTGQIRSFSATAFEDEDISIQRKSLIEAVGSSDGRAIAFSQDGLRAFVLTRSPSALVVFESGGGADKLVTRSTVALPDAPSRMAVVEHDGIRLAAVTSTRDDALAIVDLDHNEVVAILDGTVCDVLDAPCPAAARVVGERDPSTDVGIQPWGVVAVPRDSSGVRLWLGSFADGTLRSVDIADMRRPWQSRVTAVVGGMEEQ